MSRWPARRGPPSSRPFRSEAPSACEFRCGYLPDYGWRVLPGGAPNSLEKQLSAGNLSSQRRPPDGIGKSKQQPREIIREGSTPSQIVPRGVFWLPLLGGVLGGMGCRPYNHISVSYKRAGHGLSR